MPHACLTATTAAGALARAVAALAVAALAVCLGGWPALAGTAEPPALAWGAMLMDLLGGLALFLFGLDLLGEGLKAAAGARLKGLLARFTGNRISAALTGAGVTAVIQSSSVTTVLAVGFVAAGVMSFQQSIGVIMGANVGTTMTAQILAFRVDEAALGFVAAGFALNAMARGDAARSLGRVTMGLGLVFFGMGLMGEGMRPLRGWAPFIEAMAGMDHPIRGVLLGAVFTALVQSSSATTGIVIALAGGGLITLEAGIALALGANLGTCVTAVLAAIGKPAEARRVAAAHVLFNAIGVALWIGLIPLLAALAVRLSPQHPELDGLARLAAEAPRQIANANTLFNLANTALMIGFTGALATLATRLAPDRAVPQRPAAEPRWLDAGLLAVPGVALDAARRELGEIGALLHAMGARIAAAGRARDGAGLAAARAADDAVDALHAAVTSWLAQLRRQALTGADAATLRAVHVAANDLEAIGDLLGERATRAIERWIADGHPATPAVRIVLDDLFATALRAVDAAARAVAGNDAGAARQARDLCAAATALAERAVGAQAEHLGEVGGDRLEALRCEIDLITLLRQITDHAAHCAATVPPAR